MLIRSGGPPFDDGGLPEMPPVFEGLVALFVTGAVIVGTLIMLAVAFLSAVWQ